MALARPEYARIRLAFGASAFFRDLPESSLDALAEAAQLERCARGGLLHSPGTPSDKFWLVIEGGLLVSWMNARGQPIPVGLIGPGSFYSASALVDGASSRTECRAERDTVTASVPGPRLRELQAADAALAKLVPKLLLQRFYAAIAFYADAISAPLSERLARRLLGQAMATCQDGKLEEIELRTSQADLARLLGSSRSKLNAELRRLEQADVLRLGYRRIYLRDCQKLSDLAGPQVIQW